MSVRYISVCFWSVFFFFFLECCSAVLWLPFSFFVSHKYNNLFCEDKLMWWVSLGFQSVEPFWSQTVWPFDDTELSLLLCQQAGLIGENPLAALPVQQGVHLLGDLPQGLASVNSSISFFLTLVKTRKVWLSVTSVALTAAWLYLFILK